MLSSFHLSGHTLGFYPQIEWLGQPRGAKQRIPQERIAQ